jgi:hypothetical protein
MTKAIRRAITDKINNTDSVPKPMEETMKRRLFLYKASSKRLFDGVTGETGLQFKRGRETLEQYYAREFKRACEILNVEIDTLKNIQTVFLRGPKKGYVFNPTIAIDREYSLAMLMRAFADYLRFKPDYAAGEISRAHKDGSVT